MIYLHQLQMHNKKNIDIASFGVTEAKHIIIDIICAKRCDGIIRIISTVILNSELTNKFF